jgi:hypothetical protein
VGEGHEVTGKGGGRGEGEYKSGWIGERSVPRTSEEGYFWARGDISGG